MHILLLYLDIYVKTVLVKVEHYTSSLVRVEATFIFWLLCELNIKNKQTNKQTSLQSTAISQNYFHTLFSSVLEASDKEEKLRWVGCNQHVRLPTFNPGCLFFFFFPPQTSVWVRSWFKTCTNLIQHATSLNCNTSWSWREKMTHRTNQWFAPSQYWVVSSQLGLFLNSYVFCLWPTSRTTCSQLGTTKEKTRNTVGLSEEIDAAGCL